MKEMGSFVFDVFWFLKSVYPSITDHSLFIGSVSILLTNDSAKMLSQMIFCSNAIPLAEIAC